MPNLAALRVSVARAMTSVGSIARTSASTPLRYLPGTGAINLFSGSPEDALPLYVFRFPYGTGTQRLDRVTVDGGIWSLTKPFDPRTNPVDERWEAIQLYGPDAEGNPTVPVYLRANAVVQTTEITSAAVRIGSPSEKDMLAAGGVIRHAVYFLPGSNVKNGDWLQILSWPPHTTIDPTYKHHVFSASEEGDAAIAWIRATIGEKVDR